MPADGDLLERTLQALAHPGRRSIVERLSRGPASVSELAAPLPMSLPAVVQHLEVLEKSGLIRTEKTGRVRTCHLEPAPLRMLERWVVQHVRQREVRTSRLGETIRATPAARS